MEVDYYTKIWKITKDLDFNPFWQFDWSAEKGIISFLSSCHKRYRKFYYVCTVILKVYEKVAEQTAKNMEIEILQDGIPEYAPIQFTTKIRLANLDKMSHGVVVY